MESEYLTTQWAVDNLPKNGKALVRIDGVWWDITLGFERGGKIGMKGYPHCRWMPREWFADIIPYEPPEAFASLFDDLDWDAGEDFDDDEEGELVCVD